MNRLSETCFRCGAPVPAMTGREACYKGSRVWQHAACADYYRGTSVHYQDLPALLAPCEVYSHDFGDGTTMAFFVTGLRWRMFRQEGGVRRDLPIQAHELPAMRAAREMTIEDAFAVRARRLDRGTWDDPGIAIFMEDRGGSMIVDGNHRYMARGLLGETTMRFHIFHINEVMEHILINPDLDFMRKFAMNAPHATGGI